MQTLASLHGKFSTIDLPFAGPPTLGGQFMATHGAARFVYHQPSHSQTVYQQSQDLMLQCTLPAKRRRPCQEGPPSAGISTLGPPRTLTSIGQRQSWQHFSFCGDSTRTISGLGRGEPMSASSLSGRPSFIDGAISRAGADGLGAPTGGWRLGLSDIGCWLGEFG